MQRKYLEDSEKERERACIAAAAVAKTLKGAEQRLQQLEAAEHRTLGQHVQERKDEAAEQHARSTALQEQVAVVTGQLYAMRSEEQRLQLRVLQLQQDEQLEGQRFAKASQASSPRACWLRRGTPRRVGRNSLALARHPPQESERNRLAAHERDAANSLEHSQLARALVSFQLLATRCVVHVHS